MWDMSNTTTYSWADTLNFGANYRRWQLQRDLANGLPWQLRTSTFGFTGNPVADMLLGTTPAPPVPARRLQRARAPAIPREFNFLYVAPYVQDDWKVSSHLR